MAVYDIRGLESRYWLVFQATVELMIFPDFILKPKSIAAMSEKYLPFSLVFLFK